MHPLVPKARGLEYSLSSFEAGSLSALAGAGTLDLPQPCIQLGEGFCPLCP